MQKLVVQCAHGIRFASWLPQILLGEHGLQRA